MEKNYYIILGVPLDAAPDQIRSAFRRLALRYHPDRQRETGPGPFQEVSEAYEVLSDPVRRARYDRRLQGDRDQVARRERGSTFVRPDPEPLTADPVPVATRDHTVRPSLEALLDRVRRNFDALHVPKAEHDEPLNFELILSAAEAERGVLVPFEVPVFSLCYECGGAGRNWVFPCGACGGEGRVLERDPVDVHVPAGVRDGTRIDVSLQDLGIRNLWLSVHVRVARH